MVMDVLLFAEMHQAAAELKGVCLKYILENLGRVLETDGWQDINWESDLFFFLHFLWSVVFLLGH
jgi:hypothetical protein